MRACCRTLDGHKMVLVPTGHCWVEGDHHGRSVDSNYFGPVRGVTTIRSFRHPFIHASCVFLASYSCLTFFSYCCTCITINLCIHSFSSIHPYIVFPFLLQISTGLITGKATYIVWPPRRWGRLQMMPPCGRRVHQTTAFFAQ